jgi:outer membrane immunogenic protein
MKRLLLAGAAVLLTGVGFAQAADMPLKAAPPAPFSWGGFYIGATAGAAWTQENVSLNVVNGADPAFFTGDLAGLNTQGSVNNVDANATFGGKVGYNWQVNPWVFGLEADIFSLRYNNTAVSTGNPFVTAPLAGAFANFNTNVSTSWASTLRGRVGVATQNLMFYATGGAAWGNVSFSNSFADFSPLELGIGRSSATASQVKTGWAAGAGLDYLLSPSWILSVEYLHIDLGTLNAVAIEHSNNATTAAFNYSINPTSDLVRGAVAYKF